MIKASGGVTETLEALPGKIKNTRYFYLEYLGTSISILRQFGHIYTSFWSEAQIDCIPDMAFAQTLGIEFSQA